MALQPLAQSAITAATLRKMAKDLILQAEALEAESAPQKPLKNVEFLFTKEKRKQRKDLVWNGS